MKQLLSVPSQVDLVVRAVRKSAKLSQKQLAAKLGLSQNRLSELETDPGSMRVDQLPAVISEVGSAIQDLDRMTQQNAALVEQTSAASGSMREQAQHLSARVAQFRLPN